ncbi:DUF58 domain-containing protein [Ammoniphilus sp. CFH 90114]|uniref:DUF58 domain-containing protein n=1 Tax=Ammoniphilus sp. CFH 90114 TaxID=2493665 RepID=UPI00100FCDBA|nr:DUF58 domain-containing protein [Ammoniphilus sp. CFH 90114]RXT03795.1 DUF58 domain-containing protein [Ammoniphilus sp. CFH 90114]
MTEEQEKKPSQTSVLFERYMIFGVLILLISALWFRNPPLIFVSTFLLAISVVILYWKRKSLDRLQPLMELERSRVFASDPISVTCTLSNDKWLPLVWVEWELVDQDGIHWREMEKGPYIIRFLWLMGYQRVNWKIEGQALQRGVYSLGQIVLRSGDAFRFSETDLKVDLMKALYVYPALIPVSVPSLVHTFHWGTKGKKGGILEDATQITGIREYQSGDEMRRMDWLASARTGTLQTKVFQPVLPRQLMIAFDAAGFEVREAGTYERVLSIIASVSLVYHQRGIEVGFTSNAAGRQVVYHPPSSKLNPLLDDLARIRVENAPIAGHLLKWIGANPTSILFYFCERVEESHVQWIRANSKRAPYMMFYYLEESDEGKRLEGQAKSIKSLQGGIG